MPLRLKSLELHGYKTFANRSLFEFSDSVTAVVGPNGSGKSNIADSLRWVLGEQSYSLLRGKKTEDMIFAGSESRARAGMASATITFDNADNWLPIDFSEVAITRRAYRDGQNEYLINGQRVRLKDISELLAQSGLAERTYTVIGQGLVDAALSLKADERRRLFEEAAGIGLHRSRREEALRRLEATSRNLERVQDILAELKPRLHSLERQARRFQEYEQLRSDLHGMLREWYGYHWQAAQQDLAEARQSTATQDVRLERARLEAEAVEVQAADLRQKLLSARTELSGWHKQLSELHARHEALGRELAVLSERLDALARQATELAGEADRVQEESLFASEGVAALEAELDGLRQELEEARSRRIAAQKDLEARQAERQAVERQIQTCRAEIGRLNSRLGQLQAHLSENQAAAERGQKAIHSAAEAQAKADRERQAAAERHQAARTQAGQSEETLKAAEETLHLHQQELEAAEGERRQCSEARHSLSAELARLRARQEVLAQAEASLAGYAAGARALLTAARQGRLAGARGALGSLIEVPAELEKAISAVLGEYLEALVLDGGVDSALDLLNSETGRGILLPISSLRPTQALSIAETRLDDADGCIGIASNLVKAPAELQAAVDLILGLALVVRDRAAARRALVEFPNCDRAVTLDGEVFHAGGQVAAGGGGDGGNTGHNLLSRTRQRRELAAEIEKQDRELSELQQRLSGLDENLGRLRSEGQRCSRAFEEARRNAQNAARSEDQARLALDAAGRQATWAAEQHARLQTDLARSQESSKKLAAEQVELDACLAEQRKALQGENRRLDELAMDDLQTELGHWNTRLAVAERAGADVRARLAERRERLSRLEKNAAGIAERRHTMETSRIAIEARLAELRSESGAVTAEIQALNERIEPAESSVQEMETQAAALQKSQAEARQTLSIAEHVDAQTRITLARRQEALQSLQRRIEDDFGLVAFEYEDKVSGPTPLPLEGMVEQLPLVKKLSPDVEENIQRQRAQLRRLGAINPEAQVEYLEVKERYHFLTAQVTDLNNAEQDIRQVITELDGLMQREFRRTFEAVAEEFRQTFTRLFGGGAARLILTDPDDLNATGIEIQARLPGRRAQGLALLSGGERSLTAVALVFSLLKVSPTPFCVLDEVDAMLDEMNVGRFRDLLRELSQTTQFVIITHNRNTVQAADVIYGITMGRDSASQVLSLRLDEVSQVVE